VLVEAVLGHQSMLNKVVWVQDPGKVLGMASDRVSELALGSGSDIAWDMVSGLVSLGLVSGTASAVAWAPESALVWAPASEQALDTASETVLETVLDAAS